MNIVLNDNMNESSGKAGKGFKVSIENGFVREGIGKEFVNGSRVAVYSGDWKNGKRDGLGTEDRKSTRLNSSH